MYQLSQNAIIYIEVQVNRIITYFDMYRWPENLSLGESGPSFPIVHGCDTQGIPSKQICTIIAP